MTADRSTLRAFAAGTTRGLRRAGNEDALAVCGALLTDEVMDPVHGEFPVDRPALFVVADGMGGHVHGALASREVVTQLIARTADLVTPDSCVDGVRRSNLHLQDLMFRMPETSGMGTTVAGLSFIRNSVCWFNVGDSRIYRVRGAELEQVSRDDSVSRPGDHPKGRSRALLYSLGGGRALMPIQPHVGTFATTLEERWLLCSDGLTDMLGDQVIGRILSAQATAANAVTALLAGAMRAGGLDNISVVIIQWSTVGVRTMANFPRP